MKVSSHGKWYRRVDYQGYAIACAVAWAVIWILVGTLASAGTVQTFGYVFLGWVIGWISATIARVVYPAPRRTLVSRGQMSGDRAGRDRSRPLCAPPSDRLDTHAVAAKRTYHRPGATA
jgi:hypothetical protein